MKPLHESILDPDFDAKTGLEATRTIDDYFLSPEKHPWLKHLMEYNPWSYIIQMFNQHKLAYKYRIQFNKLADAIDKDVKDTHIDWTGKYGTYTYNNHNSVISTFNQILEGFRLLDKGDFDLTIKDDYGIVLDMFNIICQDKSTEQVFMDGHIDTSIGHVNRFVIYIYGLDPSRYEGREDEISSKMDVQLKKFCKLYHATCDTHWETDVNRLRKLYGVGGYAFCIKINGGLR